MMKFKNFILLMLSFIPLCLLIPVVKANGVVVSPGINMQFYLPSLFLSYLSTVFIEFIVSVLAFSEQIDREYFTTKILLKNIMLVNLLTIPLALFYAFLFTIPLYEDYTLFFYGLVIIEMVVISIESILLPGMLKRYSNFSIIKIIGIVCFANIISLIGGLVLTPLVFPFYMLF